MKGKRRRRRQREESGATAGVQMKANSCPHQPGRSKDETQQKGLGYILELEPKRSAER